MEKENLIYCQIPKPTFNLIQETLTLDSKSKAFDPLLRNAIGKAVSSLKYGLAAEGCSLLMEISTEHISEETCSWLRTPDSLPIRHFADV